MSRHLASTFLVLAACGSVKLNQLADGPVGSGSDAATGDSGSGSGSGGNVTVELLPFEGSGSAVPGALAIFIDKNGTQRKVTGADGIATAQVEDGGTVTLIASLGGSLLLQTVYGVKGGDHIVLGQTFDTTPLGTFTVNFTPIAGIPATYTVFGPCGSSSSNTGSVTLNFNSDCKVDPMELLVTAVDGNQASLGFLDKTGVSFAAGGSTTITGTFKPFVALAASFTDAGSASSVSLQRETPDAFGFEASSSADFANGQAKITLNGPTASTAIMVSSISRSGFGDQDFIQGIAGNATTYGVDVSKSVLPWLAPPTLDAATETVHTAVTVDGSSGDAPDMFLCELELQRLPTGDAGTALGVDWIMFAAEPGDLVLPSLPSDLAELLPLATDRIELVGCESLESDQVAGYDVARQAPFTFIGAFDGLRGSVSRLRRTLAETGDVQVRAASRGRSSRLHVLHDAARAR